MSKAANRDLGKEDWLRCPGCRTRRRTIQLLTKHLQEHPDCRPCNCGGYGFRDGGVLHRRGSTYCMCRPDGPANIASRAGASDEDVAALKVRLAAERACPF